MFQGAQKLSINLLKRVEFGSPSTRGFAYSLAYLGLFLPLFVLHLVRRDDDPLFLPGFSLPSHDKNLIFTKFRGKKTQNSKYHLIGESPTKLPRSILKISVVLLIRNC